MGKRKEPSKKQEQVDNSKFYRHTSYPARDKIFNWVVKKYESKNKQWMPSDEFLFAGFIYHIWDYFTMVLFVTFVYFVSTWMYDHHGLFKGIAVLAVMCLIRINALLREIRHTNSILKGE